MTGVHDAHADSAAFGGGLASWYVPGRADGFGDRLLMFDNTSTPSLELLRFRRELASVPGFEDVLRERVRRLAAFNHPGFASVRAVQHLGDDDGLALVSTHAAGQRLSDLFEQRPRKPLHPGTVTWLLREVTPALAALQAEGDDMAHGAVTPDRIVLTPEGRLCIVEHVLGSALQHLDLPAARLWREFGLVALPPDANAARLDARGDVVQLAGVALSMLLARPVTLHDMENHLQILLDEFSERSAASASHHAAPLRLWLERALQVNDPVYGSASDAEADLKELPHHNRSVILGSPRRALGAAEDLRLEDMKTGDDQNGSAREHIRSVPRPEAKRDQQPRAESTDFADFPSESGGSSKRPPPVTAALPGTTTNELPWRGLVDGSSVARARGVPWQRPGDLITPDPLWARSRTRDSRPHTVRMAIVAGLVCIALAEAAVIGFLAMRGPAPAVATPVVIESSQPGSIVYVNGEAAGKTPLELNIGSGTRSLRFGPVASVPEKVQPSPEVARRAGDASQDAAVPTTSSLKQGGVRLESPIELTVLQGERVLGSTTQGPIFAAAGAHQLELVNAALGYHVRQTITFPSGRIATVSIAVPNGRVSVNAQPGWAEVFIDQKKVGETPLANISLTAGQHEVMFRHPKLGERRQTVMVSPDTLTRVTATFDEQ